VEALDTPPTTGIDIAELVKLGAIDSELYAQSFFPKTFRQDSPDFAREIWDDLDNPNIRMLNLLAFRGSAKTTRLRTFASKRIAYGISRTILMIGAGERDAIRSVQWVRNQVERNTFWAQTFGLRPGKKWEETQIEIVHEGFGHTIWVLAAGITGSLRGINFDDYRPDLILLDDPQTDEMAATHEQREKVENLVLGAVRNSLAPVVDEPNAKLVMCATPIAKGDITEKATADMEWETRRYGCWTQATQDLPLDQQVSSWPTRFPTADLRLEKMNAVRRNKLSVFTREKEVRLTSSESSVFMPGWLNVRDYDAAERLKGCFAVIGVDPVPPPSPREIAKGLVGKNFETHYVWGRMNGEYHLLDMARNRGHDPSWSCASILGLARKWRVARIVVEAIAYQRTLKWILENEMKRRGVFYAVVDAPNSYRSKYAKISGVLHGIASKGKLWIGPEHSHFQEQFEAFSHNAELECDDDLDASAIALSDLVNPYLEPDEPGAHMLENQVIEELPFEGACP
jgi:hypothetical protein